MRFRLIVLVHAFGEIAMFVRGRIWAWLDRPSGPEPRADSRQQKRQQREEGSS